MKTGVWGPCREEKSENQTQRETHAGEKLGELRLPQVTEV